MEWARILAYISGTVDQELLLRNEYLAAENRILRAQVKGRLLLSDVEKKTLANIGYRLGRKALEDVAKTAKPSTKQPVVAAPSMSDSERGILSVLSENGSFVDEIASACRVSVSEALSALTILELKGLVRQFSGKLFALR